jgi:radical SAM-linked protein
MELKARLDNEFYPWVLKPIRYLGYEFNTIKKNQPEVKLRIALCYPAPYETGMSDIDFEVIYYSLNSLPGVWAERFFAPAMDAEKILREKNIPLFSLESKTPLSDFHIIAFTIRNGLQYFSVINMLELGSISLKGSVEDEIQNVMIGGGMKNWNPEPLADFFDLMVIGNWVNGLYCVMEQTINKFQNLPAKNDWLNNFIGSPGIYIPQNYRPIYNDYGEFQEWEYLNPGASSVITPSNFSKIEPLPVSVKPLMPVVKLHPMSAQSDSKDILETQFDDQSNTDELKNPRAILENQIESNLSRMNPAAGFLLKNGYSDYFIKNWRAIKEDLMEKGLKLNFSLPEFNPDSQSIQQSQFYSEGNLEEIKIEVGAATHRLRLVLNKNFKDDDLYQLIELAVNERWEIIHLFYYLGVPTEKDEDISVMIHQVREILKITENSSLQLSVSFLPFIPKPFTHLQWEAYGSLKSLNAKKELLEQELPGSKLRLFFGDFHKGAVETTLCRGDRSLGHILRDACTAGMYLGDVHEGTNSINWINALEKSGKKFQEYLNPISVTAPLPWDHFDIKPGKYALKKQRQSVYQGNFTGAHDDLVCFNKPISRSEFEDIIRESSTTNASDNTAGEEQSGYSRSDHPGAHISFGRKEKRKIIASNPVKKKIRIRYSKTGAARFLSHLEVAKVFEYTARNARIALIYSQGKKPHPKISFGPPLPVGISSTAEYLDLELMVTQESEIQDKLNPELLEGIQVLQYKVLFHKTSSLSASINRQEYEIYLGDTEFSGEWLKEWLKRDSIFVEREIGEDMQEVDIRPFVDALFLGEGKITFTVGIIDGRTIRISEFLDSLLKPKGLEPFNYLVQRIGQYMEVDGRTVTPLEV